MTTTTTEARHAIGHVLSARAPAITLRTAGARQLARNAALILLLTLLGAAGFASARVGSAHGHLLLVPVCSETCDPAPTTTTPHPPVALPVTSLVPAATGRSRPLLAARNRK